MSNIGFIWDRKKAEINHKKHGVSFEEAQSVFFDEVAQIITDPEHSIEEERFILLGRSNQLRLLIVCHCYREGSSIIRIISARKATRTESKQYSDNV